MFNVKTLGDVRFTSALYDDTESVFLRLWYEGAELSKPYNDPRQIERELDAHKVYIFSLSRALILLRRVSLG